jgi:hypothetical protein
VISLGVWGAPFETQGKKVLRPYMSATTAGLRLGLKLRSFGGFRPPQDDNALVTVSTRAIERGRVDAGRSERGRVGAGRSKRGRVDAGRSKPRPYKSPSE